MGRVPTRPGVRMQKHPLVIVILLAIVACAAAVATSFALRPEPAPEPTASPRVICLMPPITETLYDIGAQHVLVGRSDYCEFPPQAADIPPCGSSLVPNVEAIARLEPTLILALEARGSAREKLQPLAPTEFLPWTTGREVIDSTRKLGALTGQEAAANELADTLEQALASTVSDNSPTVLFVMAHSPGELKQVVFMKRNSLHGAILEAAGGRNAVTYDEPGVPLLSLENVLRLDPDCIVLLSMVELTAAQRENLLADWRALTPLKAVQTGRLGILHGPHTMPAGKRIPPLVHELRHELQRLNRGE